MTQVKICGLTRPEDVELACRLGAAYVGFNFAAASPRRVTIETAARLAEATAAGVSRVGVFVDESNETIEEAVEAGRLDLLQIHRMLSPKEMKSLPRPVIAVARVSGQAAQLPEEGVLALCRCLLFDTALPDRPGGTAVPFDWNALEGRHWPVPVFLAGGLTAENVGQAIERLRPDAVDVASGVEQAQPGIKDSSRMKRFFEAVRRADAG